jgi:hypothetical protein
LKRIRRYPNDVIYRLSLITSQASGHSGSSAPFLSVEHYLKHGAESLGRIMEYQAEITTF